MNDSANRDGNKEIADFNLRKSAAIFANELREGQKIVAVGKIVPTRGGGNGGINKVNAAAALQFVTKPNGFAENAVCAIRKR